MTKLAPIAALLLAATGALAQTDCQSHCTQAKDGATAQAVALQTAAQPQSCEGKTACEGQGAVAAQTVAFPADMPAMRYVIGAKETCCPDEAAQLVDSEHAPMAYKVAQVTYTDEAEAGKAYAAELENYLDHMTRVSFVVGDECTDCPIAAEGLCKKSGQTVKYKVGATVFDCPEKAIRAAALAYGKAQQVKMAYAIDGQKTECSESFAKAKQCTTTKAAYLVAGKQTECEVEAACLLATARIQAAIEAAQLVSQG